MAIDIQIGEQRRCFVCKQKFLVPDWIAEQETMSKTAHHEDCARIIAKLILKTRHDLFDGITIDTWIRQWERRHV